MHEIGGIMMRLRDAASVPDTLAVAFDAFEIVRELARDSEDRIPILCAAFMSTADAAVDGREAITIAPGLLPPFRGGARDSSAAANGSAEEVAVALAALGALLRDRLRRAAAIAATAGDRTACDDAASAAGRICQLMARGNDDTRPR